MECNAVRLREVSGPLGEGGSTHVRLLRHREPGLSLWVCTAARTAPPASASCLPTRKQGTAFSLELQGAERGVVLGREAPQVLPPPHLSAWQGHPLGACARAPDLSDLGVATEKAPGADLRARGGDSQAATWVGLGGDLRLTSGPRGVK